MSDPLFRVSNHHVADSGTPPAMDGDDRDVYFGYFENPYGEQWLFTRDRKTQKAVLRGGDIGWDEAHEVVNGTVPDLILGSEEATWLRACWQASARDS